MTGVQGPGVASEYGEVPRGTGTVHRVKREMAAVAA